MHHTASQPRSLIRVGTGEAVNQSKRKGAHTLEQSCLQSLTAFGCYCHLLGKIPTYAVITFFSSRHV